MNDMKHLLAKKIKSVPAVILIVCLLITGLFAGHISILHCQAELRDDSKYYEVEGTLYQENTDSVSMGNATIEHLYIEETREGERFLRISVKPVETLGMTGYLAYLNYFEDGDETTHPATEPIRASSLMDYDQVYDSYNDPSSGSDAKVKGKLYPRVLSIPINMDKSLYWVQIYVPVMEGISQGSGSQYARLQLDYSTMKEVNQSVVEKAEEYKAQTSDKKQESSSDNKTTEKKKEKKKVSSKGKSKLNIKTLSDGTYYVSATMLKTDKKTSSMASKAIEDVVTLKVKNGKYRIYLTFQGMSVGTSKGYLGKLSYYTNSYSQKGSVLSGQVKPAKIKSYQEDEKGKKLSDSYGSNYPKIVTFPLIKKAITNKGYVPLQVFVPVMESISKGSGTQAVYLKLDYSTLSKKKSKVETPKETKESKEETNEDTKDASLVKGTSLSASSSLSLLESEEEETSSLEGEEEELAGEDFQAEELSVSDEESQENTQQSTADEDKEPPLRKYALPGGIIILACILWGVIGILRNRKYRSL